MAALRDREVIRSENQPTGDIAELLAHRMYGGELAANSTAGWDVQSEDGTKIQVKARRSLAKASHFGFISPDSEADLYLFVTIAADFSDIVHAYEVPEGALTRLASLSGGKARPGSTRVTFRRLSSFEGKRDVTVQAREVYRSILRSRPTLPTEN